MLESTRAHANTITKYKCLRSSFNSAKEQIKWHGDETKEMKSEINELKTLLVRALEDLDSTRDSFEEYKTNKMEEVSILTENSAV